MPRGSSLHLGVLALILILGCGNSPPEILQSSWQLTLVEPSEAEDCNGISREELSLFVLADDKDGPDEVEYLYLIQEEEELFWVFDSDNWEEVPVGSDVWLGQSSLRMPQGSTFPRKNYRLLVIDKSGQRSEKEIFLAVKSGPDPVFPSGRVEGDYFLLESPHGIHTLRVYNRDGMIINEYKSESTRIPLETLKKGASPEEERLIVIFANLDDRGITLRTVPRPF